MNPFHFDITTEEEGMLMPGLQHTSCQLQRWSIIFTSKEPCYAASSYSCCIGDNVSSDCVLERERDVTMCWISYYEGLYKPDV